MVQVMRAAAQTQSVQRLLGIVTSMKAMVIKTTFFIQQAQKYLHQSALK